MEVPIIGIFRHRLTTDGQGITTLVAFHGCTLRCRYCLNPQCFDADGIGRYITPQQLIDELMPDHLYFLASGGGVTFGGGEPLLRADFIGACAQRMPVQWKINIETALHVPLCKVQAVHPFVHQYIIDIKDFSPTIYQSYTGKDNRRMLANLEWLSKHLTHQKVTIRLPHIPNYNTHENIRHTKKQLMDMGFLHFDEFDYRISR